MHAFACVINKNTQYFRRFGGVNLDRFAVQTSEPWAWMHTRREKVLEPSSSLWLFAAFAERFTLAFVGLAITNPTHFLMEETWKLTTNI